MLAAACALSQCTVYIELCLSLENFRPKHQLLFCFAQITSITSVPAKLISTRSHSPSAVEKSSWQPVRNHSPRNQDNSGRATLQEGALAACGHKDLSQANRKSTGLLAASVKACSSQGNFSARFKSYKQHSCPSPLASYHNKLLASYFHLPLLLFAPPPRLSPPDPPLMSKSSLRVAHSPGALFKPSVLSHN